MGDPDAQRLFLIGSMGAGKSTVGKKLAHSLGLAFKDSDAVIVERTGANIPLIFEIEGEDGFRNREEQVIDDLTRLDSIVLATGGGAVLREGNRQRLRNRGFVIYLLTSVDQQLKRTGRDKNRPLLQTPNPRETLENLFSIRDPLYRECADLVIDTNEKSTTEVSRIIRRRLPEALANP